MNTFQYRDKTIEVKQVWVAYIHGIDEWEAPFITGETALQALKGAKQFISATSAKLKGKENGV